MAGTYPDAPGLRIPYDRDGTKLLYYPSSTLTPILEATAQALFRLNADGNEPLWMKPNNEGIDRSKTMVLLFPELRDITHLGRYERGNNRFHTWSTSANTTNGVDGTWLARTAPTQYLIPPPTERSSVTAVNWLGIIAIKMVESWDDETQVHLYGGPAAGQNPDRLRIWHPTMDVEVTGAHFDYADFPRSTSADKTFRIKNNSTTLTANTITVSVTSSTNTTPSVPGQYTFAKASVGSFAATVVIPSLAPGGISEVITVRRVTPVNAIMGIWWARALVSAASWS